MKKVCLILILSVFLFSLSGDAPKYIFLFIGDGMAIPQRMIAEDFSKKMKHGPLLMNSFPYKVSTKTSSASSLITDSAAAATAIACGEKTKNGMVGMTPDKKKLVSCAVIAKQKGKKVGIISSVAINHATPAGFYGKRESRSQYYELGLDLVNSSFDFFAGGGITSYKQKSPDIYTLAKEKKYKVVRGRAGLESLKKGDKAIAIAKSLHSRMPYAIDLDKNTPTLAELTKKGIEVLDNDKEGFFLMVEGGAIDYAGHANEAAVNIREVLALDAAVKMAYEFYKKHPDDTLIIVTGDHETGGMTMGFAGSGYKMNVELLALQKCSVGAFHQKLSQMRKKKKNLQFSDVKPLITEKFGLTFAPAKADSPMFVSKKEKQQLEEGFRKKRLSHAVRILMNQKAGVAWTTGNHTAMPVLTVSIGKDAEKFKSAVDNTHIAKLIKSLL